MIWYEKTTTHDFALPNTNLLLLYIDYIYMFELFLLYLNCCFLLFELQYVYLRGGFTLILIVISNCYMEVCRKICSVGIPSTLTLGLSYVNDLSYSM